MPTYDYRCSCGFVQERFLAITKAPERTRCPQCKKQTLQKLIGGAEVVKSRGEYPYYNWQLPLQPGQKLGEPNVMSREHENEIMRGAMNGERYERNAI